MSKITTQLEVIWDEKSQRERVIEAKALLQDAMNVIAETNTKLKEIVDEGSLDTIPAEAKAALSKAWSVIKTADTSFHNEEIKEVLTWSK
jgi:hypothetical protein